jgi:hypothetical protein
MKFVLATLISALLVFSTWSGYNLYKVSQIENELKYDHAELNLIKYGLFNIDIWKTKIFSILESKAGSFKLKDSDFNSIQKTLENYLTELHEDYFSTGKIMEILAEETGGEKKGIGKLLSGLFKGKIEEQIEKIDFKSRIPGLAIELTKEIKRKSPEIQKAITDQISNMIAAESENDFIDQRQGLLDKYDGVSVTEVSARIIDRMDLVQVEKKKWITYSLVGLILAMLLSLFLSKWITFRLSMVLASVTATLFLTLGLLLPMIELDARLTQVDLMLLGEAVHFDEQYMYYQSKSIIDVTRTLLEGNGIDLKIVGLLILLFSIILPLSKMIATNIYLYAKKARTISLLKLLIFHLGKWSMADVFVVAIFMSYIGFHGLVSSQLGDMERQTDTLALDTVNYSGLASGIIFFTLYCLFSIVISTLIHRKYEPLMSENLSDEAV